MFKIYFYSVGVTRSTTFNIFELILQTEHQQKWKQIRNFQSSTDPNSEPSEISFETELWVQGNLNKKGRMYGLGLEGMKLKHLFKSTSTSRGSQEPNVWQTVTQLNNELSSMTELNRGTEERNCHLEEKVMMLNEQLSGVQNTVSLSLIHIWRCRRRG